MSALIRRLLGVPSKAEIRAMILREIDADYAWQMERSCTSKRAQRLGREGDRDWAITLGTREDTRG